MDELHKTLWTYYGYSSFRPGQERLIRALLEGNDVLGVMPTGAGKSLCYQIPALLLPGLTIVVSPLISLMEDQVGTLRKRGIPAAFLHAAMRSSERRALCQKILDGQRTGSPGTIRLLYVSPERLMAREFLSFSENADISLLAVDEAHCISNWGRDFRPAYRKIGDFADRLKRRPPIGAFTASATPAVREEIISYLHLKEPASLTTGFDRPNLYFEVRHAEDKWTELLRVLAAHSTGTGIIYCLTRKTTEALAKKLNKNGIPAAFYHGGLTSCEREKSQEDWIRGRVRLIVATCAFGMGIDKPDVRFVIHYNLPGSMENYYQEAGRASRDGRPGECILLYNIRDVTINKFFIRRAGSGNTGEDFPQMESTAQSSEEKVQTPYIPSDTQVLLRKTLQEIRSRKTLQAVLPRESLQEMLRQDLLVMQDYVSCHTCLRAFMLRYFGEETEPFCGKCSVCLSDTGPLPRGSTLIPGVESPELYRELRALRLDLANRQGKLPFEIFSDRTLHDLAAVRPENLKDMLLIEGAGILNVLKFGPVFLKEIRYWNHTH